MEGDPEAPEDQQGEYQHDDAGTHQAQLLADHGEDAVVVLLGQVEEFLPSLAQAHAQQAAGADGDETLGDLPAVAPVPIGVEGVPPGVDTILTIVEDALFHQGDVQGAHQAHADNASGDQPALDAAHDHQNDAGADNEDGAGQVRLQHHKARDNAQDQQIRPDALTPGLHFLALFGDGGGKVDDHGNLGDLGGLEPQNGALDAQPAGGAVFRDGNGVMGNDDQHQQRQGRPQQQTAHAPQTLIVQLAESEHNGKAQQGENALADEVVRAVAAVFVVGGGEAGG